MAKVLKKKVKKVLPEGSTETPASSAIPSSEGGDEFSAKDVLTDIAGEETEEEVKAADEKDPELGVEVKEAVELEDEGLLMAKEPTQKCEIVVLASRTPAPVVCGFHFRDGTLFTEGKRFHVPGNVANNLQENGIAAITRVFERRN